MEFEGKRASGVGVGNDFDVGAVVGEAGGVQGMVKFGAGGYFRGVPSVAAEGLRQFRVTPVRDIVVFDRWFLTEKPFDKIAGIVEDEDYWFGFITCELRDFLRGKLMRALAGEQDDTTIGRRMRRGWPSRLNPTESGYKKWCRRACG
jgi:hypothetical protein